MSRSSILSACLLGAPILALGLALASTQRPSEERKAEPEARKAEWSPYEDIGLLAAPPMVAKGKFDRIRSGMTLRELTDILGQGWMRCQIEGCGIIKRTCADGRQLEVWPTTYRPEEVIDAGPRQIGGAGGRGRMWMIRQRKDREPQDVPIPRRAPS